MKQQDGDLASFLCILGPRDRQHAVELHGRFFGILVGACRGKELQRDVHLQMIVDKRLGIFLAQGPKTERVTFTL